MASIALEELKERLGDRVRIVTAGSWARPEDLGSGIQHLGLLDYRETGNLYRTCDVGVALTVSEHPSYLPLELMACGVPVVASDCAAGVRELVVDDVTGLLVRPADPGALARATRSAIAAPCSRWTRNSASPPRTLSPPAPTAPRVSVSAKRPAW